MCLRWAPLRLLKTVDAQAPGGSNPSPSANGIEPTRARAHEPTRTRAKSERSQGCRARRGPRPGTRRRHRNASRRTLTAARLLGRVGFESLTLRQRDRANEGTSPQANENAIKTARDSKSGGASGVFKAAAPTAWRRAVETPDGDPPLFFLRGLPSSILITATGRAEWTRRSCW